VPGQLEYSHDAHDTEDLDHTADVLELLGAVAGAVEAQRQVERQDRQHVDEVQSTLDIYSGHVETGGSGGSVNRGPELLGVPGPRPKNSRVPDPVAGPRAPKPYLRSQHFGLPVLALGGWPRELRAPRLLLNQSPPPRAWLRHCIIYNRRHQLESMFENTIFTFFRLREERFLPVVQQICQKSFFKRLANV